MPTRRTLLGAAAALAPLMCTAAQARVLPARPADAEDDQSFARYLDGVKAEARRAGISQPVLDAAFAGVHINRRVIELDRNQPEVQFTWARYRTLIVSDNRVAGGRAQYKSHGGLLESDYGRDVGKFNVIEAVATLAWDGRRGAYFRSQLMDCLKILQAGDIRPQQMVGSWAGAMGQTQFMPDSFLKFAVDFDHRGARDLWNDFACVFASTANNLAKEGWRAGVPWGYSVELPPGFDPSLIGRTLRRPAGEWARLGVRRQDGGAFALPTAAAALVQPGAPAEPDTFLVYATQFAALRAYNPSDKYALSIGLLADRIAV
jgi:membrane-bound lytic murein transglycosylase B